MPNSSAAINTALLPQYQQSETLMERFLVAAHESDAPIERAKDQKGTIKVTDSIEIDMDSFGYFIENKDKLRSEFICELKGKGIKKSEIDNFCEVVSKEWFDGARLRKSGRPCQLKRSVLDYLFKISPKSKVQDFVQTKEILANIVPLVSEQCIASILTINNQMLYRHIQAWKSKHKNSDSLSDDDVFFRRGLALAAELDTSLPYREWDFINSYSLAFTAPEKFSQMAIGQIPAIVNGDYMLFSGRVLFFSPFIPGMDFCQFEAGIIPSENPLPIKFQGIHRGISEYILAPRP